MKRGPKPKPTARRRLEGNPGKRRLNDAEPQPPPLDLDPGFDIPPPELGADLVARAEWVRLAPMLRRCRQITQAERAALIALCLEWARYLHATEQTAKLGMIVKAPSGYPITNPYLAVVNRAFTACRVLWAELGLTPSSRSRVVRTEEAGAGDAFAEFDQPPPGTPLTKH